MTVAENEVPLQEELTYPFTRDDTFGELGMGSISWKHRVGLIFGCVLLVPIRALLALVLVVSYWLFCIVSPVIPEKQRFALIPLLGRWHCRACLFVMGFIKINWVIMEPEGGASSGAPPAGGIVSNHTSWADILVHMSRSFPAFVARDATKATPFIGLISQLMGCVYVDRIRADKSQNGVAELVRDRMRQTSAGESLSSRHLLLYPEGTTSNGKYILPFKTGAFLAGVPVQPVIIQYEKGWISPTWESIPIHRHLILLLAHPCHSATFTELPVYVPNAEERADPRLYATNVRELMMKAGGFENTAATFEDKMRHLATIKRKYGILPPVTKKTE
ncbi:hypothetical protein H632_c147p2 [Helicosporidium sp. ATCC 50920]|nr:hypothetical protein H632_c147p2 [Helicosporidium sp. ATCC 50920]|eukprot:KDD76656.1 hypothetical protein H632_c147p2 [Helicosporidium sp. ATCC 50920]